MTFLKNLRNLERTLVALMMAPLVNLENNGREKRLQERMQRLEYRRAAKNN
jgi:hypothetical protein